MLKSPSCHSLSRFLVVALAATVLAVGCTDGTISPTEPEAQASVSSLSGTVGSQSAPHSGGPAIVLDRYECGVVYADENGGIGGAVVVKGVEVLGNQQTCHGPIPEDATPPARPVVWSTNNNPFNLVCFSDIDGSIAESFWLKTTPGGQVIAKCWF